MLSWLIHTNKNKDKCLSTLLFFIQTSIYTKMIQKNDDIFNYCLVHVMRATPP